MTARMKRSPVKNSTIRALRPGEQVPEGVPKRYRNGSGYIRLRWKVGVRLYVEAYEHRVLDGFVTTAEHVHHKNHDRADNRPENLVPMTAEEHKEEHTSAEAERGREMASLYRSGVSIPKLAKKYRLSTTCVYRRIAAEGVPMRTKADYAAVVDADEVAELYRAGRSLTSLASQYRVEPARMTAIIRSTGTQIRKPGRPKRNPAAAENAARLKVRARSGGACEVCRAAPATNFHHRKNRSQGGEWSASNGFDLCGSGTTGCHGHITTNPKMAMGQGWTVRSGRNPADVPVWVGGHGFCFLLDDGSIEEIDEDVA